MAQQVAQEAATQRRNSTTCYGNEPVGLLTPYFVERLWGRAADNLLSTPCSNVIYSCCEGKKLIKVSVKFELQTDGQAYDVSNKNSNQKNHRHVTWTSPNCCKSVAQLCKMMSLPPPHASDWLLNSCWVSACGHIDFQELSYLDTWEQALLTGFFNRHTARVLGEHWRTLSVLIYVIGATSRWYIVAQQ